MIRRASSTSARVCPVFGWWWFVFLRGVLWGVAGLAGGRSGWFVSIYLSLMYKNQPTNQGKARTPNVNARTGRDADTGAPRDQGGGGEADDHDGEAPGVALAGEGGDLGGVVQPVLGLGVWGVCECVVFDPIAPPATSA